ncbi:PREDICTED: chymotrypsin-2-like isoform X1 [Eufriesea mexicana]|uniref:chymotrypsin-2-like isoform X1 n=1 Tax=Eufriesea mexicana TaxID=516756 RepID=UPI00083BE6F7|nr:PREDICTED: chymotrypsin-2-like isoform X1 [Eufriesea mexicana]
MKTTFTLLTLFAICNAGLLPKYDPRIVNGEKAKEGEIPYQVSLQNRDSSFHFCGGSILNENYVITAAHCVSGKLAIELKVVAGTTNLAKPNYEHNVVKIIMHEDYNPSDSWKNDISLLKVEVPFVKSKLISFVVLPSSKDVLKPNDVATVSGWGRLWQGGPTTIYLQRVNILIANQEYCRLMYNRENYNVYDSQICAYDPSTQKGSCHGDSGGPLTVNEKIVGLVSWSTGCALINYPTVFTRVTSYLDWICKKAKMNSCREF